MANDGRVHLGITIRVGSRRCPGKALAVIGGKPLPQICWERTEVAASYDGIKFAYVAANSESDMVAWTFKNLGLEVVRGNHGRPFQICRFVTEHFGLKPNDILVWVSGDEPFGYCEDLQHRIDVLKRSGGDWLVSAPTGHVPIRDWEWACGPKWIWTVRSQCRSALSVLDKAGSIAREGTAKAMLTAYVETGYVKPVLVDKPSTAKEVWPWQPLWVDEPEQLEKARLILEDLGVDEPVSDAALREYMLAPENENVRMMGGNAMRRTLKVFFEDERMVEILRGYAERDGVYPAKGDDAE